MIRSTNGQRSPDDEDEEQDEDDVAEDTAEWGAFGFMFVVGVLSFVEAKPRNASVAWAKLKALSRGAAIASDELWAGKSAAQISARARPSRATPLREHRRSSELGKP